MKVLVCTTSILIAVFPALADIKPVDSEGPVLQYFEAIQNRAKSQTGPPKFTINEKKPLLTISSFRDLIVHPDGSVIAILNDKDKKIFARLTHRLNGGLIICTGTRDFMAIGKVTSPTDDGVLEFSNARYSGETAKYLRRRFGR